MKLRLPKLLLSAIVALGAVAQGITLSQDIFEEKKYTEDAWEEVDYILNDHSSLTVIDNFKLRTDIDATYIWNTASAETISLTGVGRIYAPTSKAENPESFLGAMYISVGNGIGTEQINKVELGKNIIFDFVDLSINVASNENGKPIVLDVNSTFVNGADLDAYGNMDPSALICDINDAKFIYGELIADGTTYRCDELTVSQQLILTIEISENSLKNLLIGNLTLNGGGILSTNSNSIASTVEQAGFSESARQIWGGVHICSYRLEDVRNWGTLNITGNLKVTKETGVYFMSCVDQSVDYTGDFNIRSDFDAPGTNDSLFICGSVDAASLSKLKPYSFQEHYYNDDGWEVEEWVDYKPLNGKFVAKANIDGKVHVYYCENGATPLDSTAAATKVATGATVIYDSAATKPYYIDGGTLDATAAGADLDTAHITGAAGVLKTTANQTLTNSNGNSLGYGVAGGANMRFNTGISTLSGKSYETSKTTVDGAFLIISENSTLGTNADSELQLSDNNNASTTNFGTVKGKVQMGEGSTFLNQGTIDGIVAMSTGGVFTNNGTITGDVDIVSNSYLYGSGTFEGTTRVQQDGLLYIGNSPGYQKHNNLTLASGSNLGFCIDGRTAASADNNGYGTHSFMSVSGTLTLDGVVNVNIDINGGIAAGGTTPFTLTLLKVNDPSKITVTNGGTLKGNIISGGELLVDGSAKIEWKEEMGELIFSGQVTQEAVDALKNLDNNIVDSGSGPVGDTQPYTTDVAIANTLWASTGVVKDFATTATNQFLIGKPGQTTTWGAALGTFISHGGSYGFDYNGAGYAVGVQHAVSEQFRLGLALGQSFGTFTADNGLLKSDQMGIMAAITAQYVQTMNQGRDSWGVSGYLAYGGVENDATTPLGGSLKWDDTVLSLGLRADYRMSLSESSSLTFFTGFEYTYGSQDTIAGILTDGRMQTWSIPVGITLRTQIDMCCHGVLVPEITVAYVGHVSQQAPTIHSGGYKMQGSDPGRNELMLNVGTNWLIDENWSVGLFYNLEVRSDATNHSGNLSVRYAF